MTSKKLSVNKITIGVGIGFTVISSIMLVTLYMLTEDIKVMICGFSFVVLTVLLIIVFIMMIRKKLTIFSSEICRTLDGMMTGNIETQNTDEDETLLAKIDYNLIRLYEVMQENNRRVAKEKTDLQELISDISHQVKMPIANLKMVTATLLEQNVPEKKQREFLQSISGQLDKLDFLMQAMIKMSRLETGVITLVKKDCSIYETLATALGGILLSAESKNIHVTVDCAENLTVNHDSRWTAEALFNILDNAVKYTPSCGKIHIAVTQWEMHTKINISDTGKGISESRHTSIFKRFYREEEVHDTEGIGIGLYLAREIITMQGGYIKVTSEVGTGSTFSVFLPNN
jgi:signal transduction histidine kinase